MTLDRMTIPRWNDCRISSETTKIYANTRPRTSHHRSSRGERVGLATEKRGFAFLLGRERAIVNQTTVGTVSKAMILLERTREGLRQSNDRWNCFKGNAGETAERQRQRWGNGWETKTTLGKRLRDKGNVGETVERQRQRWENGWETKATLRKRLRDKNNVGETVERQRQRWGNGWESKTTLGKQLRDGEAECTYLCLSERIHTILNWLPYSATIHLCAICIYARGR